MHRTFRNKQVGGVIDRGRGCKVIIDIKNTGVAVKRSPAGASIITIEKSRICSVLIKIHLTRHKNIGRRRTWVESWFEPTAISKKATRELNMARATKIMRTGRGRRGEVGGGVMLSFARGRDSEMLLPKKTATTTIANNITIPAMCTGNKCGLSTSINCNQDLARGCTVSQRLVGV